MVVVMHVRWSEITDEQHRAAVAWLAAWRRMPACCAGTTRYEPAQRGLLATVVWDGVAAAEAFGQALVLDPEPGLPVPQVVSVGLPDPFAAGYRRSPGRAPLPAPRSAPAALPADALEPGGAP